MEEQKYKQLLSIFSDTNVYALEECENVKSLFKRFLFLENKNIEMENIWIGKDEIKKDSEYYGVIKLILDSFINSSLNKISFSVMDLANEINNIMQKSKFSVYYNNIFEISKKLDLCIENYSEIVCALYCLGFKKESGFHMTFIKTIKEFFILDERIQCSKYSCLLNDIDYDNIDEDFMLNLNSLLTLILENGDEEKIKILIKKFKKSDNSTDLRINSVSKKINDIEKKEKKLNCDISQKGQKLPSSYCQNSSLEEDERKAQDTEKNNYKSNDQVPLVEKDMKPKVNEEKNKEKEVINTNTQQEKYEINEKDSKENKNKIFENNPVKKKLDDLYETKEKEDIDENDLDSSFELIGKQLHRSKKNEEMKKEESELDKIVRESVQSVFQRFMRYNYLIQLRDNFTKTLKEYYLKEYIKREINEDKVNIEKLEIQLNELKTIVKFLLSCNIVNIKIRILYLIIFSIIKLNKDSLDLKEENNPNQNFLQKFRDKLEEYAKKDNIIEEQKIDSIIKFLSTYKKDFNHIQISKKQLRNYFLSFNDGENKKLKDFLHIVMKENKNNMEEDEKEENEEEDSSYKIDIKIDIKIIFDILLNDKTGTESVISELEKKLNEIESKKNEYLVKYSNSKINGCNMLLNECKIIDYQANDDMEIFTEEEKTFIENTVNSFKESLTKLKIILSPFKDSKNDDSNIELIDEFFRQFKEIINKELKFNQNKYYYLCETTKDSEGRDITILFQIKIKKYEIANIFLQETFDMLDEYYESKINENMILLNDIKKQEKNLFKEITDFSQMKSYN